MSNRIKNIINEVRTDVSGKWVSIDDLENHTKSVIDECLDVIKKHLFTYFTMDAYQTYICCFITCLSFNMSPYYEPVETG